MNGVGRQTRGQAQGKASSQASSSRESGPVEPPKFIYSKGKRESVLLEDALKKSGDAKTIKEKFGCIGYEEFFGKKEYSTKQGMEKLKEETLKLQKNPRTQTAEEILAMFNNVDEMCLSLGTNSRKIFHKINCYGEEATKPREETIAVANVAPSISKDKNGNITLSADDVVDNMEKLEFVDITDDEAEKKEKTGGGRAAEVAKTPKNTPGKQRGRGLGGKGRGGRGRGKSPMVKKKDVASGSLFSDILVKERSQSVYDYPESSDDENMDLTTPGKSRKTRSNRGGKETIKHTASTSRRRKQEASSGDEFDKMVESAFSSKNLFGKKPKTRSQAINDSDTEMETEEKETECPVCFKTFKDSEIAVHAADCGV